jgi:DNA polymerase-1
MRYFIGNKIIESEHYNTSSVEDCLAYFAEQPEIELDTETTGLDPHTKELLCMQLGTPDRQYVIDTTCIPISKFKPLLEDKSKLFLLQNAKFDLKFLFKHGIEVSNVYDTMLAECLLTAGHEDRSVGLKTLAKKYLDVDLDKTVRGSIHKEGLSDRVIIYAADDVRYLTPIKKAQMEQIKELQLENVLNLENEVVKTFARMEYVGVLINQDKWLEVAIEAEKNVEDLILKLDAVVDEEPMLKKFKPSHIQGNLFGIEERHHTVNWSSPKQKLEIIKALDINIEDVSDRTLQKNKRKHSIIGLFIEYSKQAKLASSFGRDFLKFVNPSTKKIHPNYWQILSTGRISVSEPNVNQIPARGELGGKIRSAFIPSPGKVIVGGDYSGMELRIIAALSKDPLWVNAFKTGQDLHSVLCAATFGIPITDVKKPFPEKPEKSYRDVQKTINFGLAYGMSKFKLADTMGIPVGKADEIIKKFFSVVPKVKEFLDMLGNLGKARGYIRTSPPYRRIRRFKKLEEYVEYTGSNYGFYDFAYLGSVERASKNMPIQGTNGDVIKLALCRVSDVIKAEKWPVNILLSVYDEIQTECDYGSAKKWKNRLDQIMIEAAEEVIKDIPIVVDCSISTHWSK